MYVKEYTMSMWTGFNWLRIRPSDGLLWTR